MTDDPKEVWYEPGTPFPDSSSTPEEREYCSCVIACLREAESHLIKGPALENRGMASLCCAEALIALGHFSELRSQRLAKKPETTASDFWDVQTLRVITKGLNSQTVWDGPYNPEWADDYRGRPEFLGEVPPPAKDPDD